MASWATAQPGVSESLPCFLPGEPVLTLRDGSGLCRDPHGIGRGFSSSTWARQAPTAWS